MSSDTLQDVPQTVEQIQKSLQKFGAFDYVVFAGMLFGCAAIGIFYAFRGKKNASDDVAAEYLMGGRNMNVFPIAMSLIASFISGITLLGLPTETYIYGTEYLFVLIGISLSGFIASSFFIPVLHDMKLSSTYEYLERRYDKKVRLFASLLFAIGLVFWLPIVIYVPALAFNQVTGIDIHVITPCVCIVCIFYTAVGGLKAVVWTDVVQTWMMVGGILIVVLKGAYDIGGFGVVWQRCWDSGRLETPSFQFDVTKRLSFWSVSLGAVAFWTLSGFLNQAQYQRYMALNNLTLARRAIWIFTFGVIGFYILCGASGLVVYATYYDCDPLTTKLAKAKDQLLPFLVMRVLGDIPGMPGLFVSGVFSAALSSLSTGLNSMSAVVLEDFIKPFTSKRLSDKVTGLIMRSVVVFSGVLCVGLVYVVEKLGSVLQLSLSLGAMTSGPSLGIFCAGVFLPWVNAHGAFYGGIIGLMISAFVILGSQQAQASGLLRFPTKPTSIEGCDYAFNITVAAAAVSEDVENEYVFPLFRISFLWYTLFGGIVTIILAVLISMVTKFQNLEKLDPSTLYPQMRKFLPRRKSVLLKKEEKELIHILKKNQNVFVENLDSDH